MAPKLLIWTQRFTSLDGGMGVWTEQLANWACRLGWDVHVTHFTPQPAPSDYVGTKDYRYEAVLIPPNSSLVRWMKMGQEVWRRRSGLDQKDFLIIIFGEPSNLKFFTFLLGGKRVHPYGMVVGCRTLDDHIPDGFWKNIRNRWFRRWIEGAVRVMVDGEDIRQELVRHGLPEDRIQLSHAGIDIEGYHPELSAEPFWQVAEKRGLTRQGGPLLLFHGRIAMDNRPRDVFEILRRMPDARAVFIGDGPLREEMEQEAEEFQGRACFLGYQPDEILASAFRAADVSLFPLSWIIAGVSLAVPKAMACGAVVIASDVADMSRLIRHEQNGLLCKEGDIDAWVGAIRRLMDHPDLRQRLGQQARLTVEREWTEAAREDDYREWFDALIASAGSEGSGNPHREG